MKIYIFLCDDGTFLKCSRLLNIDVPFFTHKLIILIVYTIMLIFNFLCKMYNLTKLITLTQLCISGMVIYLLLRSLGGSTRSSRSLWYLCQAWAKEHPHQWGCFLEAQGEVWNPTTAGWSQPKENHCAVAHSLYPCCVERCFCDTGYSTHQEHSLAAS